MLQRFAGALFGGSVEQLSLHCQPEQETRAEEEEEEEDWILVNYLGEANTDDHKRQKKTFGFKIGSENARGPEECLPKRSRAGPNSAHGPGFQVS